jgi:energy-coupling factor transport system ATP-binding protein
LAIAAAIALRPAVLALDEPTSQLDPLGAVEILRACRDLAAAGTAVVVSEHRCAGLLPLADSLGVMAGGSLSGPGPVREMAMRMDDPPQLVALGRLLGWGRVALTTHEALSLAPVLRRPPVSSARLAGAQAWELASCAAGPDAVPVFSGVDLGGTAGEVCVLMGPNGGGKTTLLRVIAGLQKPLAGTAARRPGRVAYLPQDPAVLLHRRSVQEEVDYTLRRAGSGEPRDHVLRRLGLTDLAARYPGDLSSGQRHRAALAAILAGSPGLVLLDEPTRGMDAAARTALVQILREMAAAGASVVVATHDADLAADLADRVLFVADGAVRDGGRPENALSGPGAYSTDIGRIYPGGPVTVQGVLACL